MRFALLVHDWSKRSFSYGKLEQPKGRGQETRAQQLEGRGQETRAQQPVNPRLTSH
ncbi:MAG: hypothetical protein ACHRXM_10850 [Isosphaerales bacterium]